VKRDRRLLRPLPPYFYGDVLRSRDAGIPVRLIAQVFRCTQDEVRAVLRRRACERRAAANDVDERGLIATASYGLVVSDPSVRDVLAPRPFSELDVVPVIYQSARQYR
jgi:hypothetical protein